MLHNITFYQYTVLWLYMHFSGAHLLSYRLIVMALILPRANAVRIFLLLLDYSTNRYFIKPCIYEPTICIITFHH